MCIHQGSNKTSQASIRVEKQKCAERGQEGSESIRQTPRLTLSMARWLAYLTLLLSAFLSAVAAAQNRTAEAPGARATPDAGREERVVDAKKIAKYDVNRIGQRDIGRGVNIYSLKRERALGERLAAVFDRSTRLVNDEIVDGYITRLAGRIARNSDAALPFTVRVFDSADIPRAYGFPGGFLYVSRALILSADGEAELAGVMAHEIAHVAARHATRALTRRQLVRVAGTLALFAGPAGIVFEDAGGVAGPLSVNKFDRDAEYEADLLGAEYAYAAGYDPEAVVAALEKLHALELARNAELAKIPGYHLATKVPWHRKMARGLASYPATEERIRRLQQEIPAFLPSRNQYIVDTEEFEEVKSRLLASTTPVLRRHSGESQQNKGPVLRRTVENGDSRDLTTHSGSLFTFR
jgi:predicted Zn-dependent protease